MPVWRESGGCRAKRDGKEVSEPVRRWTPDGDGVAQVDLAVGSRRLYWPPMGSVADAASPGSRIPRLVALRSWDWVNWVDNQHVTNAPLFTMTAMSPVPTIVHLDERHSISDSMAARLTAAAIQHVLFLKNQIPL